MHELDDNALLREFAGRGSEPAFAELVTRHVNQVYSVALRHTRNPSQAEEITQAVFVILAQKACKLGEDVILSGWLYQTARLAAVTFLRGEIRRARREQESLMQTSPNESESDPWPQIAPLLDDAMARLNEADRHAVVLRYFDGKSLKEVGAALGASEDAAKMRVNRAVEKLRTFFAKRGVGTSTAMLTAAISANSVQSAPIGFAAAVTAASLSGTALTTSTILAATKTIAMTALQKTIATATIAVLAGVGIYEARQAAQLRDQVQMLHQQQAPLNEQIQQLQQERDDATNRLAGFLADIQRLSSGSDQDQILKLRGEVARLRAINLNSSEEKANDPFTRSVLALVSRAAELNQHLQRRPENRIPELQLLDEKDWLTAAEAAKFDTDADIRKALQKLRSIAKSKLPFGSALYAFASANNGDLPKDISQLKPYFDKSRLGDLGLDDLTFNSITERYALLHTGNTKDFPSGTWFIVEKAPIDTNYDSRAKFGLGTSTVITTGSGEAGDPDDRSY